jgi:serine/threonine protein kinase
MVDAIPVVQRDHAMFSRDENGDGTIDFYPDYVQKTVKNFDSYCKLVETTVDAVGRAYEVSARCSSLPQRISDQVRHSRMYIIEIKPAGYYPPSLRSEQDVRNMARCVCEALCVLHMNGLVHRDIRLPNIFQIVKDQFMVIDLEAAATCPNRVPPGFPGLRGWSGDALEGGYYTKISDMYQLGQLLASMGDMVSSPNVEAFIQQLLSKNLSAELALKDLWLSNPVP